MQEAYLAALAPRLAADARIRAAWLEGSYGRGEADRYADLDLHLLLGAADFADFQAAARAWLEAIRPLVLFNVLFDGRMINAVTDEGLRLDVWLHSGDTVTLDPARTRTLAARQGSIVAQSSAQPGDSARTAQTLERQTQEFWRCIALLPGVVGRQELIVGLQGLLVETNLLCEILIAGYGIQRDAGVKRLNRYLPRNTRQALEHALALQGLSQASLARAHLLLARVLQQHGPLIAERHSFPYPSALERTVLGYVHQELSRLGLEQVLDVSADVSRPR